MPKESNHVTDKTLAIVQTMTKMLMRNDNLYFCTGPFIV